MLAHCIALNFTPIFSTLFSFGDIAAKGLIHSKYAGRIVSEVALPILCKINFKRHFKSNTIKKIIKFLLKSNYEFILYALLVDERNVKRYYKQNLI